MSRIRLRVFSLISLRPWSARSTVPIETLASRAISEIPFRFGCDLSKRHSPPGAFCLHSSNGSARQGQETLTRLAFVLLFPVGCWYPRSVTCFHLSVFP